MVDRQWRRWNVGMGVDADSSRRLSRLLLSLKLLLQSAAQTSAAVTRERKCVRSICRQPLSQGGHVVLPSSQVPCPSKACRLQRVPTLTLVLRRRRMCCMSAYALADVVSRRRWSISTTPARVPTFAAKSAILPSCASLRLKFYALKRTSSTSGVAATHVTQRRLGSKSRADFVSRGAQLAQLEILQPSQSSFPTIRIGARVRLTWNCW